MSFFFLLNPKNFLDPGGLIKDKFGGSHKKKKKLLEDVEFSEELYEHYRKFKEIDKKNKKLLKKKAKEAELEKRLQAHKDRIKAAQILLAMEEEELAVLMLIMLD